MVFCALDNWNCSISAGNHQHIHRITSLPSEDIKKYTSLDYSFHHWGLVHYLLLPVPGQVGLYTKARSHFGWWTSEAHSSSNFSMWKEKGISNRVLLKIWVKCRWKQLWSDYNRVLEERTWRYYYRRLIFTLTSPIIGYSTLPRTGIWKHLTLDQRLLASIIKWIVHFFMDFLLFFFF